jgi:hypothetical protein
MRQNYRETQVKRRRKQANEVKTLIKRVRGIQVRVQWLHE